VVKFFIVGGAFMQFNLRKLLYDRDMKQAKLSRLTGIRKNTINAYYHGYIKRMNVSDLENICDALNCKLSDIIDYTSKEK
jgi:putative transcriptional regulator